MSTQCLHIPVDLERTHEFRLLVTLLRAAKVNPEGHHEKLVEAVAVYVLNRLFFDLSMLARSTNRPGYLTANGKLLFESSLEPLFGDAHPPTRLLQEAGVLKELEGHPGELFCPLFAQENGHLAGGFVPKEVWGNARSQVQRQKKDLTKVAYHQATLLPVEVFRKREGTPMTEAEINRAMTLIVTVDNYLKLPARSKSAYTESLIADAFEVSAKYAREPETLDKIYAWIKVMRDKNHPLLPSTTEQVLADFDKFEAEVEG